MHKPTQIKLITIKTGMFPKRSDALAVRIAPKIATICIRSILTINPIVFSLAFAQAVDATIPRCTDWEIHLPEGIAELIKQNKMFGIKH